ncbi:MAG: GTPase [Planctomycetes bacterium]|nr:GTPase [Planctomycetota bacterium]
MQNVLILGAAGKDFHVFNTCFRASAEHRVVAFTATQIPNIDGRRYPPALAGPRYPEGIPIHAEAEMPELVRRHGVNLVVFAYSDVSYAYIEERRRLAEAAGASFALSDPDRTQLPSRRKVVAICAVRTGSGKSQTTRRVAEILRAKGRRVVVCRHPMPYGDLAAQEVQRFGTIDDLARHQCTVEEMEEYEPHLRRGNVVYAGVDYGKILAAAEAEADVVLWDGGNNDTPFFRPDLWIVVADPLRPGHELSYYPGRVNFERAHAIVINKCDSAPAAAIESIVANARAHNPNAAVIRAASPLTIEAPGAAAIKGKRALCIEDGPTVTHGDMGYGAAMLAAERSGAGSFVEPRKFAVGTIAATYAKYPNVSRVLPAMGYGEEQLRDLAATINRSDAEIVVIGTPVNLCRFLKIEKPTVRVTYELAETTRPDLSDLLAGF